MHFWQTPNSLCTKFAKIKKKRACSSEYPPRLPWQKDGSYLIKVAYTSTIKNDHEDDEDCVKRRCISGRGPEPWDCKPGGANRLSFGHSLFLPPSSLSFWFSIWLWWCCGIQRAAGTGVPRSTFTLYVAPTSNLPVSSPSLASTKALYLAIC